MTTLEDRIADLQQQAGLLLDLPQQIADAATARINQIGAYWDERVRTAKVLAYVDQAAGNDSADGTEAAPLRSIDEALRRTPPGGALEVRLLGPYHFAAERYYEFRHIRLRSAGTVRHQITLERLTIDTSTGTVRGTGGLRLGPGATAEVDGLTIQLPMVDGVWSNYTVSDSQAGLIQLGTSGQALGAAVRIRYCDVVRPSTCYCPIIGRGIHPLSLEARDIIATDQPLTGWWVSGASDPAGTDPATLPWLLTNLTTV